MRIVLANEARAGGGGVESYLAATADALTRRGHDVALLYGNTAAETGPTTVRAAESWSVTDEGLEAAMARVRAWRPDVVFSHNMRRLDVDEALVDAWPVVKMMHGYFGTCVSGQKTFLTPSPRPCSRRCGVACLALYAPRRCGRLRAGKVVRNYRWATRQRALFDRYRAMVVASGHMRNEYVAHGVAPARVHAIPLFPAGTETGSRGGASIDVLFLGRITQLKGSRVLPGALKAAAARLGRPISATIAGEGPDRARLQTRLSAAPNVRAVFPGWVNATARADLFARSRVVAMPSVWPEPFGLVGLEAAPYGVPSIAFDVGGISEWLTDAVNGRLVPLSRGADGFGAAIADVLDDEAVHAQLGAGARAAAGRFSVDAHLTALERVLDASCRS